MFIAESKFAFPTYLEFVPKFFSSLSDRMEVLKKKVISLKFCKKSHDDDLPSPTAENLSRRKDKRRFSLPYGKLADNWKKENMIMMEPCREEEEYPIYQSASFKRYIEELIKTRQEQA